MKNLKNNTQLNIPYDPKDADLFVEELKKEPMFKGMNITINNANLFNASRESFKYCKNCKGLDSCPNSVKGFNKVYDAESDTLIARECKYKKLASQKEHDSRLFKTLFMPETILNDTLDNYETNTLERQKALKLVTKFITEFNDSKKGVYLTGPFGVGKTYLLAATANELSRRGVNVILAYFPDLVREIKNNMTNGEKLEEILNTLKTIDVLMLDDLGSENLSSWLRDEIIGPVINYRYEAGKPICISSNLSVKELLEHFSQTNDGKDTVKGNRLMKRIAALCGVVTLNDDSQF